MATKKKKDKDLTTEVGEDLGKASQYTGKYVGRTVRTGYERGKRYARRKYRKGKKWLSRKLRGRGRGWYDDPNLHALASKGVKTKMNTDLTSHGRDGVTDEDKAEYWKWRNHHENLDYEFKIESREGFSTVKIYRAKTCGCEKREVTNNMGDTHIEYATCLEHQHLYPDMFKRMRDNDVERVVD